MLYQGLAWHVYSFPKNLKGSGRANPLSSRNAADRLILITHQVLEKAAGALGGLLEIVAPIYEKHGRKVEESGLIFPTRLHPGSRGSSALLQERIGPDRYRESRSP